MYAWTELGSLDGANENKVAKQNLRQKKKKSLNSWYQEAVTLSYQSFQIKKSICGSSFPIFCSARVHKGIIKFLKIQKS